MPVDRSPQAVLEEIAAQPRGDDLARLVHTVAFAAADEKRATLSDGLAEVAERLGVKAADADTAYGNALRALERDGAEAAGSSVRALLGGLLARGVALSRPSGAEAEVRVAESLVWLAAHTSIDAFATLDLALGEAADGLWVAVAAVVRHVDAGEAPLLGRPGAIIAAAALRESRSSVAHAEAATLVADVRDPLVRTLLTEPAGAPDSPRASVAPGGAVVVKGELVGAPRGPVALVLLGFTGLLAAMHVARFLARVALGYRRPAELRVSATGVVLHARTELLGRTLREREVHIPIAALLKAAREVRYPRLALYTGLATLALGSYFGVSIFVDGARAGSPELLGIGLLLVLVGVALDYVLENIVPAGKEHCRMVIVPRKGPAVALGLVDPTRADEALAKLLTRAPAKA